LTCIPCFLLRAYPREPVVASKREAMVSIFDTVSRGLSGIFVASLSVACAPEMVAGTWPCATEASATEASADGNLASVTDTVSAPWAIGFENEFCDYPRARGFCYTDPDAAFEIVDAPVHSGRRAAAFSVATDPTQDGQQARCVRQGTLPSDAIYGAWYFVPSLASNTRIWNLMHFQGGPDATDQHGLWDVSLDNAEDGGLFLYVFNFLRGTPYIVEGAPEIPVGVWFHIEFRLRRAADASGEVALYQDGQLLLLLTALSTDDSEWAQWHVGSYATGLTPAGVTVYVDDVSIQAAR
jgi:hypothetical protein